MALIADLTLNHMEALSAIDRMERSLDRLRRSRSDLPGLMQTSDRLARQSVRLRRQLDDFFQRERQDLFPRIRRLCGQDAREIEQLTDTQTRVLESLDQFIVALREPSGDGTEFDQEYLRDLGERFSQFIDHYDQRCSVERSFYRSFSTLLFPGGVATD